MFYLGDNRKLSRHFSSVAWRLRGLKKAASPHPKVSAPTEALLSHIRFAKSFSFISPISILRRFRKRQGFIFPPLHFPKRFISALSPFRYVSVVFAKVGHRTPNPTVLEAVPNKTRSFR